MHCTWPKDVCLFLIEIVGQIFHLDNVVGNLHSRAIITFVMVTFPVSECLHSTFSYDNVKAHVMLLCRHGNSPHVPVNDFVEY